MERKYLATGIFFIFLELLVVIRNLGIKDYTAFFWFCDMAPLLLAAAFLLKNNQMVKGLVSIGLVPQLISSVSLFFAVFLGIDIVGFADILNYSIFYITIAFILHLFSLNVALVLAYRIKPKPQALIYSLVFLAIIFSLSLAFTPSGMNINYVYNSSFLGFTPFYYTPLWFIFAFFMVVLPTYLIQKWMYNIYKHRESARS